MFVSSFDNCCTCISKGSSIISNGLFELNCHHMSLVYMVFQEALQEKWGTLRPGDLEDCDITEMRDIIWADVDQQSYCFLSVGCCKGKFMKLVNEGHNEGFKHGNIIIRIYSHSLFFVVHKEIQPHNAEDCNFTPSLSGSTLAYHTVHRSPASHIVFIDTCWCMKMSFFGHQQTVQDLMVLSIVTQAWGYRTQSMFSCSVFKSCWSVWILYR